MRASETAEMIFDNCRVPDTSRMGEVGDGFRQSLKVLDGGKNFNRVAFSRYRERRL